MAVASGVSAPLTRKYHGYVPFNSRTGFSTSVFLGDSIRLHSLRLKTAMAQRRRCIEV